MTVLGIALIIGGVLSFLYNGYQLFVYRKFKKADKANEMGLDEMLAPSIEYNSSMLWVSLVAFTTGLYLVYNQNAGWSNIIGLLIGLYGISAFIQSFRPYDTAYTLMKAGRDLDLASLYSTMRTSRIIGIICFSIGIYIFV